MYWRKSSHSDHNGACVEVAVVADPLVGVRDSKNIQAGHLMLPTAGWNVFVGTVKGDKLMQ